MRKLKFCLFSVLIIGLSITSCKKENNEMVKTGIVPLKTGNRWTYEVYGRSNRVLDTLILQIGDYVRIEGIYGFRFISGDNSFNETFLVDNDENGNFMTLGGYSDLDTLVDPSIRYVKDARKGESWDHKVISYVNHSYFEKADIQVYCINSDTIISTPKGEFRCKVYKWSPDNDADIFIDYVSENIGVVKYEHFENNSMFRYHLLVDYKIGK